MNPSVPGEPVPSHITEAEAGAATTSAAITTIILIKMVLINRFL